MVLCRNPLGLKYDREILPVFAPDFVMPDVQYLREQFNYAYKMLKNKGYFVSKDDFLLKKVRILCEGSISGHKECVKITSDFDIDQIVSLIKKSNIHIFRFKGIIINIMVMLAIIFMVLSCYISIP